MFTMAKRALTVLTVDSVYALFTLLFVYWFCGTAVTGTVTLSPGSVAPVCQTGDPLELTCTISGTFIRWSFVVRNEQGRLPENGPRFINSEDESQQMSEIRVNSATFTFMRTSSRNSSPLISSLVIDSVSSTLNGTVVHCEDEGTSMTASTTIRLFDESPSGVITVSTSEEYRANNILVLVDWTQEEAVSYNITTVPMVPIAFTGRASVQLIVLYNIVYNVTLEAVAVCRSVASSHVQLFYVKCGYFQLLAANDSKPNMTYSGLPIQGTMATFSCPLGMILNGTNTTTCTRNGEWKPDPQDVNCVNPSTKCGHPMIGSVVEVAIHDTGGLPADIGTTLNFTCPPNLLLKGMNSTTCAGDGEWTPDPSGVKCTQGITTISDMSLIIVGVSTLLGVSILLTLSTCAVMIVVNLRKKGLFKRSSTHSVYSTAHGHEEFALPSIHDQLPNTQNESEYSVLQHAHDRSGAQKTTDVGESAASKVPDIPHGLQTTMVYADLAVTSKKKKPSMPSALDLDDSHVEYAQINYKIQKEKAMKPQALPEIENDGNLDDINLDSLLIQLRKHITSKWYQFGEAAGIKKEVLDNFAESCALDDCIVETLDFWLRNYEGKPTWRDVAVILRAINLQQLAFDIEQVYTTGKLPIEADMDDIPPNVLCKSDINLSSVPEIVPPIPPKNIKFNDERDHNSGSGKPPNSTQFERKEDELPPLPPKTKYGAVTTVGVGIPVRPPKH